MANSHSGDWTYFRRLLMTVAVVGLAYGAWQVSGILMLAFAAVVIAVLLAGFANVLEAHTPLSWSWALAAGTLGIALLLVGAMTLFGAQLAGQLGELVSRVPRAIDQAGSRLGIFDASAQLVEALSTGSGGHVLSRAAHLGYTFLGVVADFVLVLAAAIYLAADRFLYRNAAKLFPPDQQESILPAMIATARALRLWFLGQLVSMVLVGILSGLAFWAIGLPLPIGLGFIAGLTNFIPLVGPLLGAVPAVVLAMTDSWTVAVWTVLAVIAIQQLEGYVLMPLIQRRAVDIPPAIVLLSIAVFGALFGLLGVALAVPLSVVVLVLVQKIWIREVLGERTRVAGESR